MDFLEVLAECSIALAGFGAVHAALQGSNAPRGVFRAWTVVLHGVVAFILSVVPLLLALSSLSEDQNWRGASAIAVIATAVLIYSGMIIDVRLARLGYPPQAPMFLRSAQASSILAALFFVSNAFGWPWSPGPFLYAVGPVLILVTGLLAMLHAFVLPVQLALDSEAVDTGEP